MKTKAIYAISCLGGDRARVYIGSTIDLKERITAHFSGLRRGKHRCKHMQNAFNKYGEHYFVIDTLQTFDNIKHEDLRWYEKQYIEAFLRQSERYELMNSTLNTACPLDDPEVREKQKRAASQYFKDNPEFREAVANRAKILLKRLKENPEHVARMTERLRQLNSDESFNKKRVARLKQKCGKPILCVETGEVFLSSGDAAKWVKSQGKPKASQTAIGLCCRGGLKSAYGYTWKFAAILDNSQNL